MAYIATDLNAESFWWWQCSIRYNLPHPPPPGMPDPTTGLCSKATDSLLNMFSQPTSQIFQLSFALLRYAFYTQLGTK